METLLQDVEVFINGFIINSNGIRQFILIYQVSRLSCQNCQKIVEFIRLVNSGGTAGFDGIIFADGFIGQKGMPILMNKTLAGMLTSILMFSIVNVDDRILPVEAGKRVELWVNGWDENDDALTVCDFDGSIKLISRKDGNDKCTVFAIEELWDLKRKRRDFSFDSSTYTTYKQWMVHEYWGELGLPKIEPASRLTNLGFHSDFGNNTISKDWSADAYEGDMINAFGFMSGHIMVWSPEGFLISTKYIPFTFTYNTEDSVKPQPIIGCRIDDDLIHYYNAVYVSGDSYVPSSSTDTTEVADYGMKAKTKLFKTMPKTEADLIAANLLGQWHDSNPHIYLTILGLNPHIQPGCIVQVTIPSAGITALDMMVVQKKYHVGTWRGRGTSGQEGAMTLVLSYCDPDALTWRMPRMCTEDYEEVQHILEEVKSDRKALF